jgi:hypothetical protein
MRSEKDRTNEGEGEVNQGSDTLLRHDFNVIEADPVEEITDNDNVLVELIKGWKPISHRARDLIVDYFRKLRARALPPRRSIPSRNEDTGISS